MNSKIFLSRTVLKPSTGYYCVDARDIGLNRKARPLEVLEPEGRVEDFAAVRAKNCGTSSISPIPEHVAAKSGRRCSR